MTALPLLALSIAAGLLARRWWRAPRALGLVVLVLFASAEAVAEIVGWVTRLQGLWALAAAILAFSATDRFAVERLARGPVPLLALLSPLLCWVVFGEPLSSGRLPGDDWSYYSELYSGSLLFGLVTLGTSLGVLGAGLLTVSREARTKRLALGALLGAAVALVIATSAFGIEEAEMVPHGSLLMWSVAMIDPVTLALLLLCHAAFVVVASLWWFDHQRSKDNSPVHRGS